MRMVAGASAAAAVYLLWLRRPVRSLTDRAGAYLTIPPAAEATVPLPGYADAGIPWSRAEMRVRTALVAVAGAVMGVLAAQGDLFVAGAGRSAPALGALGAAAGVLGLRMFVTRRRERRRDQLRAELPVVADLIALRVLAGEGVAAAVEQIVDDTSGVVAADLGSVVAAYRSGAGMSEALQALAIEAPPQAGRLYGFLANAHVSGGRLAEALIALAADLRAEEERRLQIEGGKRALAVYAPILALMVPTALVFLMYPTLAGLADLSAGP